MTGGVPCTAYLQLCRHRKGLWTFWALALHDSVVYFTTSMKLWTIFDYARFRWVFCVSQIGLSNLLCASATHLSRCQIHGLTRFVTVQTYDASNFQTAKTPSSNFSNLMSTSIWRKAQNCSRDDDNGGHPSDNTIIVENGTRLIITNTILHRVAGSNLCLSKRPIVDCQQDSLWSVAR